VESEGIACHAVVKILPVDRFGRARTAAGSEADQAKATQTLRVVAIISFLRNAHLFRPKKRRFADRRFQGATYASAHGSKSRWERPMKLVSKIRNSTEIDAGSITRKTPRWHLVYFVLAAFDLVTISTTLYLNHSLGI